jgi:hypothetical protein
VRARVSKTFFEHLSAPIGLGNRFILESSADGDAVTNRVGDYVAAYGDETPDHRRVEVIEIDAGALEARRGVSAQPSDIDSGRSIARATDRDTTIVSLARRVPRLGAISFNRGPRHPESLRRRRT